MKNSKQIFKRGLLSCMVAALAIGFAVAQEDQEETVWTDVTQYFIVNPDYSNGTTGWTDGTAVPTVNATYENAEFFKKKNSALQTISNLPIGNYKLTVQALFRPGGNSQSEIDKHIAGTEVIEGYVVAGDSAVKIKSLYSEPNNATVDQKNGYPNSMKGANAYFTTHTESYMNEVYFTITDQTPIKIGIDVRAGSGDRWTCWDNFKLYKEGEFDPLALLKEQTSNLASLSEELTTLGASAVAVEVNAYITTYNGYTSETSAETISDAVAEAINLTALISGNVIPTIESLNAAVAAAENVSGKYADDNAVPAVLKDNLTAAITDAKNVLATTGLATIVAAAGTEVTEVTAATKALTNFVALTLPLNKAKALADRIDAFNANKALAETDAYEAVETSLTNAALGYDEMATNVAALNTVSRDNMTAAFLGTATEENPIDMTSFIVNPYIYQNGVKTANPGGWTCVRDNRDGNARTTSEYDDSDLYAYFWSGNLLTSGRYHQELSGLPAGIYDLKAVTCCNNGSDRTKLWASLDNETYQDVNFSGDNETTYLTKRDALETNATVENVEVGAKGVLYIGVRVINAGGNGKWFRADNFTLLYTGSNKNRLIDGVGFHAAEEYIATTMNYDREFTKDTWLTVCLPFAYTLPEGVVAEELKSVENGIFTFAAVEAMEANKPYLIKNTTETAALFAALENVTVAATPAAMETTVEGATMVGVYESVKAADLVENNDVLFFNTKGELKYLDAANTAAVEAITFTPFRAYILVDKNTFDDSTAKTISVRHDDGTTSIEHSTLDTQPSTPIYDLMGRRVQQMEKGIYIVNGKKVVIR